MSFKFDREAANLIAGFFASMPCIVIGRIIYFSSTATADTILASQMDDVVEYDARRKRISLNGYMMLDLSRFSWLDSRTITKAIAQVMKRNEHGKKVAADAKANENLQKLVKWMVENGR